MLRIRLTRTGRTHAPAYRIVVMEKRSKRDGKYIDQIGYYNPNLKPAELKVDEQKMESWVKKGAQVSEGLKKILTTIKNK